MNGTDREDEVSRRPALFEREDQLRLARLSLRRLLDRDLDEPRGRLVVFEGAAGLGKTTLLASVRRLALRHDLLVLSGRGGEREQDRAFHVVRQLFRRVLAGCSESELETLLGGWRDVVSPAVGLAPATGRTAPDPQGVRDALDWMTDCLTQRHGGVVILVDDAHWADLESLTWLESFAHRVEDLPVLVIVARRPEEPGPSAALLAQLARATGVHRNELAPLTPVAVARLVATDLGAEPAPEFALGCREVSGGNPYVLGEVLREIRSRRLAPDAAGARLLPEIAQAVVGRGLVGRLERLGGPAVALARAAAVLGADARPDRVAALAGLRASEVGPLADRLRAVRVLDPRGGLDFAHPLVATEVYRRIPASLRSSLHAHAARLLTGGHESGTAQAGARAAATHLLAVEPAGDPWVVDRLRAAARQDMLAGAPEAAFRALMRAVDEPPPPKDRAAVRYELGLAAFPSDPRVAIEQLREALRLCGEERPLRDAILVRLAKSLAHDDRVAEAVRLLEDEIAGSGINRARLRLQAECFLWAVFWADEEDAHRRNRQLRQLAGRLTGHDPTERHILGLRAWYGVVRGDPARQVLQYAEQAAEPALSWVDEDWTFEVPALVALSFMYCDRPERAEALFQEGIAELEAQGWRGSHLALAHTLLGLIHHRTGNLRDAETEARYGLELAMRLGPSAPARWYAVGTLVQVLLARGLVEEAWEVATAHDLFHPNPGAVVFPVPRVVAGELLLTRHQDADAAVQLETAGEQLDRRRIGNPAWCPWRPFLALALARTDPVRAERLARRAMGQADVFNAPYALGQAQRITGLVTGGEEGVALLERSRRTLENSPARYEFALTLVELGAALRRARRIPQARLRLSEGLDLAVRCGADGLAERAQAELLAAGGRPRRLYRTGARALTPRERQAARLAADGWTNPRIAQEMGIRLGTVNKHMTEVYAKLGVDRSGLAEALGDDGDRDRG